jgi:superfamily I DNA/RNA helicase
MKLRNKELTPTDEQQACIEAARRGENLMIKAMAGCTKTSTLEMIALTAPIVPSLYVAFAKKNVKEAEKVMPDHFDVKTANGLGHSAWARAIGKRLTLEEKKIGNILKEVTNKNKVSLTSDDFVGILALVRRARVVGLIPRGDKEGLLPDTPESWERIADSLYTDVSEEQVWLCRAVLKESIRQAYQGVIDFDDQIYMSALFGGVFPRYQRVVVDEGQDLNLLNHIQISKTAIAQLAIVGDPRQAIYAFRGADSGSMDTMRELRSDWTDLPLSTTFRCPKVVVERQQSHAPGYNAAATNAEGEVKEISGPWQIGDHLNHGTLAILCRNNAPLIGTALRLISQGQGCTVLGKDIGKGLSKLLKDIAKISGSQSAEDGLHAVTDWAAAERSKAIANGKDERIALIEDKAECLYTILNHSDIRTVQGALLAIDRMFASENLKIMLSTGHKAKGLEWPSVIHLDPWRIPSKYAKASAAAGNHIPLEQDMNLKYVIETRTQHTLITATAEYLQ